MFGVLVLGEEHVQLIIFVCGSDGGGRWRGVGVGGGGGAGGGFVGAVASLHYILYVLLDTNLIYIS